MVVEPLSDVLAGLLATALGRLLVSSWNRLRAGRRRGSLSHADTTSLVRRMEGSLKPLLRGELAAVPANELEAAATAVRDSLAAAESLDLDLLFATNIDSVQLEQRIRATSVEVRRRAALSGGAVLIYDRLLTVSCARIVTFLRTDPAFADRIPGETLKRFDELDRKVTNLPGRLRQADRDAHTEFTARYCQHVARTMGTFEMFGVTRGRAPRKHSFRDAYVRLSVARPSDATNGADEEEELTGHGVGVVAGFADAPRVILRGGAGSGKTTLLEWLAVEAAEGRLPAQGGWRDVVPFVVHLREFAHQDLPLPDSLPRLAAAVLAGEMPAGWATQRMLDGQAMLLVDGVDELVGDRRTEVERWLAELVAAYPEIRYVVTTRPTAIEDGWLAELGFVTFDLLPLSGRGIEEFRQRWFRAARGEPGVDEPESRWLEECERGFAEVLAGRRELRRLAGSPLLCGLLCALYRDGNMNLPRDLKGLYEAALELLLEGWDEQRRLRLDQGLQLTKEEQTVLLQRVAYWMTKNQTYVVDRDEAVRRVSHAMVGLRSQRAEPEGVLQRLLERTGLLRAPHGHQVQFIHRTFRDYLAAKEAIESGDLRLLVNQAHYDEWQDVVIMAVAHARPIERDELLDGLLRRGDDPATHGTDRDRLHLLAAVCQEQADVTQTDEVRQRVIRAAQRLIPPASLDDAETLARAGAFVLDLLPGPDGLSEQQAAAVVRTAARIGGDLALEKINEFSALNQSLVLDELLRACRLSDDPADYAKKIMAGVTFGDRTVRVRGSNPLSHFQHLTGLRNLSCAGDLLRLGPIAAIPRLRCLELEQNHILRDLSPLAGCRTLRELHLSHCGVLVDLSPLASTAIELLSLRFVPAAELASLAGAPVRSLRIRDRRLATGLDRLPADLPLRELILENRPAECNLRGVGRWPGLAAVWVAGVPGEEAVRELAALPDLRRLVVRAPAASEDLVQVARRLPACQVELVEEAQAA